MIFRFAGTAIGNAGLAQAEALRCNMLGRRRKPSRLSKSALFLVVMLAISAGAGSPPSDSSGVQQILDDSSPLSDATILIIRHAEKPGSGSGLSVEGGGSRSDLCAVPPKLPNRSRPAPAGLSVWRLMTLSIVNARG